MFSCLKFYLISDQTAKQGAGLLVVGANRRGGRRSTPANARLSPRLAAQIGWSEFTPRDIDTRMKTRYTFLSYENPLF